ncbi:ABC transporter permease [Rhodobacteraceae bacterium LMO-12]|nr:ABC transporter permease [Rhodobacteraceae bacterium LMO-JJ12]
MKQSNPAIPRRTGTIRTVIALLLREMSTTYGRSALGYVWAVLEPAGGIAMMTIVFSFAFRSPAIGTNFPLFFASGILPFMAYSTTAQKVSVSLRFSRSLLFYPGVTFVDAILGRFLMNVITEIMIAVVVLSGIIIAFDLQVILDLPALAFAFTMAFALGLGIGTMNCYLLSMYPIWEVTWAILNRPLFIISCIFFLFDTIPLPYRDWLWWNPLVHLVGEARSGVYSTYDASYVSPLYVFSVALVTFAAGLLMLRRHYREIINS